MTFGTSAGSHSAERKYSKRCQDRRQVREEQRIAESALGPAQWANSASSGAREIADEAARRADEGVELAAHGNRARRADGVLVAGELGRRARRSGAPSSGRRPSGVPSQTRCTAPHRHARRLRALRRRQPLDDARRTTRARASRPTCRWRVRRRRAARRRDRAAGGAARGIARRPVGVALAERRRRAAARTARHGRSCCSSANSAHRQESLPKGAVPGAQDAPARGRATSLPVDRADRRDQRVAQRRRVVGAARRAAARRSCRRRDRRAARYAPRCVSCGSAVRSEWR